MPPDIPPPSPACVLKVSLKKRAVKTAKKSKILVFKEENIFSHIKVCQLQSTKAVNKDVLM